MIMKIKLTEIFNGRGSYVTPSVKVLEIASEGLLCMSGELDAQDWKTGETNWFE
jgi:hypothetical protein